MEKRELDRKTEKVSELMTMLELLNLDTESLTNLKDDFPVSIWVHDSNYNIVYGNEQFIKCYGNCLNKSCHKCLMGQEKPCSCCLSGKSFSSMEPQRCRLCKRNGFGYDINTFHTPSKNKNGEKFILKVGFHSDESWEVSENIFSRRQEEVSEDIFLTMCSTCNKIKDKKNNWISVDLYLLDYFNTRVSHGICPDCIKILYPDLKISPEEEDHAV